MQEIKTGIDKEKIQKSIKNKEEKYSTYRILGGIGVFLISILGFSKVLELEGALIISCIIAVIATLLFYKIECMLYSQDERNYLEAIKKEKKEEHEKRLKEFEDKSKEFRALEENDYPKLENVKYISGFIEMNKDEFGVLVCKENTLYFFNTIIHEKLFEFDLSLVRNMTYDLSSQITLGRALVFGLGALVLKKNTYYLILEYVSEKGIENQLVFETGNNKNMQFYNTLNTARNKYGRLINNNNPTPVNDDIYEQIRKLSELQKEGIITEEEFKEKKKILLDKII